MNIVNNINFKRVPNSPRLFWKLLLNLQVVYRSKGVIIKIPSNKFVLLVQVPAAVPPLFVSENNGAKNIMSNVPSVGSTKQNDNQELFFSDI